MNYSTLLPELKKIKYYEDKQSISFIEGLIHYIESSGNGKESYSMYYALYRELIGISKEDV